MKIQNRIYGIAAATIVAGAFAACTNELNDLNNGSGNLTGSVSLVKDPKVIAWSGSQNLGNNSFSTRGNEGDGDTNNTNKWNSYGAEALENITDAEREAVLAAIAEKKTGSEIDEEVVFPWESYFLQDVINFNNGSFEGAGNNGMKDVSISNVEAFSKGADCRKQSEWYSDTHTDDYANYAYITNSKNINNYYLKGDNQERIQNTALMTNMTVGTYEEMKGKQFRVYQNCHLVGHYSHYITVNVDGSWYICFDFGCTVAEHDKDGDPGKDGAYNDWDYNDWILKIIPGTGNTGVWPEQNTTEGEEAEIIPFTEVEVNLSILDEHEDYDIADLVSKLSIHVRAATDVEVVIPVPAANYIAVDDMYIFNEHYDFEVNKGAYGHKEISYDINGNTVTLTIVYNANNITVTTSGINEEVFNYCRENYGDGINFEIYNYYNNLQLDEEGKPVLDEDGNFISNGFDRSALKECLKKSTIQFLDEEELPDYYINAFNDFYFTDEEGNEINNVEGEKDCTVSIISDQPNQREKYNDPVTAAHLNNGECNLIYKNKQASEDLPDGAHGHDWLWGYEAGSDSAEQ